MCASAMICLSPQVEQREDEDPHQVDEVPVEAGDLDDLPAALARSEEALLAGVEIAAPDLAGHQYEEDHPDGDVGAVEAGDHEEHRAELRRPPGVLPRADAFGDQLGPLERLHADE